MNLLLSGFLLATVGLVHSATWTPVDTGLPSRALGVSAIVPNPNDPSTLYAITNLRSLYKSIDGAATWRSVGGIAGVLSLAIDPGNSATLYVGSDHGMLKSTDAGASWTGIWDFSSGIHSGLNTMLADPANPNTLYAGVGDGFAFGGVFKSTDGGANWVNQGLRDSAVTVLAVDSADSNTLYAATAGIFTPPRGFRGIYKTIDGGETWLLANNGLDRLTQNGVIIVSITMDAIRPGTAYAATNGDGVYTTVDGGATWTPWNEGLGSLDVRALAVAEDALYAATASGVFKADTN